MGTGATSLSLVRNELFASIDRAEAALEQFTEERADGQLLQDVLEGLQQIRGAMSLIELVGAELLAQEMQLLANDIPAGADAEWDVPMAAVDSSLYVLRRYLENIDNSRQEIPEVLLPAINELRLLRQEPLLPESYFFSARVELPRDPQGRPLDARLAVEGKRFHLAYQVGLVRVLREDQAQANLRLMSSALKRIDLLLGDDPRNRLCWVASAALEAMHLGNLRITPVRRRLLGRLDRELKALLLVGAYQPPKAMLTDLLYLVALSDCEGPYVADVRGQLRVTPMPFTDHMLEEEAQRLAGPGRSVMRSLSSAIREELARLKDLLDLAERGSANTDDLANLNALLGTLDKTLNMIGLSSAGRALQRQLPGINEVIQRGGQVPETTLQHLADAVLYVESMLSLLERGQPPAEPVVQAESQGDTVSDERESVSQHQLAEAQLTVLGQAQDSIAEAKRAITIYFEANGDTVHLLGIPDNLYTVQGALSFIGQDRAAAVVGACRDYLQTHLLDTGVMPSPQKLEILADALTGLEYYLETGGTLRTEQQRKALTLAEDSMQTLGTLRV